MGPKTINRLTSAIAQKGTDGVRKAIAKEGLREALDRLATGAEPRNNAAGTFTSAIRPAFDAGELPRDNHQATRGPGGGLSWRNVSVTAQRALNDANRITGAVTAPLKEDGFFGPKSGEALAAQTAALGTDRMTQHLSSRLSLDDADEKHDNDTGLDFALFGEQI